MKKLRIFCDFDGTISLNDLGNLVFTTFGDERFWWDLVQQWRNKKISGRELWTRQAAVSRILPRDLDRLIEQQPLDPGFKLFYAYCRENNTPLAVLSDGMDAYIKRMLVLNGMGDIDIFSNHMDINSDGTLRISFPYFAQGCGVCANCKGYHIRRLTHDDEFSVYVGDGYSDLCALAEADVTFAKADLQRYCEEKGIEYRTFENFCDVLDGIRALAG
ncbi:MtnX-like HAD-IB family phosphatase [candidate division KSB1 bacterium]|nr:MtnX-like HAD-IB family phosphatase [candidate division KSB1 bacterium]